MKRFTCLIFLGILLLLTVISGCGGGGGNPSILIVNEVDTDTNITEVYIRPYLSSDWGTNCLGSSVISPGSQKSFSFKVGYYDYKIVAEKDPEPYIRTGFNFHSGRIVKITLALSWDGVSYIWFNTEVGEGE